jgi:hypothetical protein
MLKFSFRAELQTRNRRVPLNTVFRETRLGVANSVTLTGTSSENGGVIIPDVSLKGKNAKKEKKGII